MADRSRDTEGERTDETAELSLGEIELFDPPTDEIEMLEEIDDDPPPVPRPGLGRPPKPKAVQATTTLPGAVPATPSAPPPPPRNKRKKKAAAKNPSPPPAPRPSAPPADAPAELEAPAPPEPAPIDASAEELRRLCEEQLRTERDPERKARLSYELGRIYEADLRDDGKAAEHYQATLRHAPDHAAALRGARRTLARLGRHPALPALYDAEAAITREPTARARLVYAKARVMEEHLRQTGPALAAYRAALELDPGNLVILKAIERALRRDKAWAELAAVYEQLTNAVEDAALKAAWTAVRAQLTETKLGDPVQAAALYEAALEADPHATAALANVKRLGTAQKRWPQLVDALTREHALTTDAQTKLAILATIARIRERRLGDADAAVDTLEAAIDGSPGEAALLRELVRLHRAAGRHAAEIGALTRLYELVDERGERARVAHRTAQLHDQMLGDGDRAAPWYQRALEAEPDHRAAALALFRLHEARERWTDAIGVLQARAEALTAPRERAELHHRIGALLERELEQPEEAAAHHARALGLAPDHHDAFEDLARLHASAGRWRELAELYERAIDRAANDAEAIAWLFRLGGVLEDRLDDAEGALAAYARILERDGDHLGALHASARAAERAGQPARAVEVLEKQASLAAPGPRRAALLHRAATLTADALGDASAASRALEALTEQSPDHLPSLETLARLYADGGQWDALDRVYGRLLPLVGSAREQVRLHLRRGDLRETQLGDDGGAIDAYAEALQLDPDCDAAREARIAALTRAERWSDLSAALLERIGRLTEAGERARAWTELGELREERQGDRDGALEAYEKALEAMPLHRPALDARERLLTDAGEPTRLAQVLGEEAERLDDPFLESQAALRAALLLSEQGAANAALDAFRPVFAKKPEHVGALLAVEEIYARTRDDAGLAATYEKMAEVLADPKAKLAALSELARVRAATDQEVTSVRRRILKLAGDDAAALEALAEAAEKAGEKDTALAMQARLASTSSDPRVGAHHQSRVGAMLLDEGDAQGALAAFRAALALDPQSLTAARGLTRAARLAQSAEALRAAAKHESEITRDRDLAVGLLLEAARIAHESGEGEASAADFERALAIDPENVDAAAGLVSMLIGLQQFERLVELLTRAAHAAKDPSRIAALHLEVARLQAEARRDLPAAVAAAQRALDAVPNDQRAQAQLALHLEQNGQWEEAAAALERVIAKAKESALVDAHLRLARIAEKRLGDADRAIRSLRAVLARDEESEEALAALVRLERAKGRDEEALRLAKKLISVVSDPNRKAETLAELAELERARGEGAAAAAHAMGAVGIQGPNGAGARVYKGLVADAPEHASWDHYATALMGYLESARALGGDVAATYLEIAKVQGEALNRPDRAINILREGVEACPDDEAVALTLVRALQGVDATDKAIAELRRILAVNVRRPRAWRAMADAVRKNGEPDGAAVVLAPLVAMSEATDDETRTVTSRQLRVAVAPPGILGEQGLEQLADGAVLRTTAAQLLAALDDVFGKLEGVDLERWGVSKRDRLRQGDGHPLRAYVDRVGAIFGVPEVDVYEVDDSRLDRATVLAGSPPALLVPARVANARDPVLAFHLARPLALLSRHLHPLDAVPDDTTTHLLVGTARQFDPTFVVAGLDESLLDVETKRVGKAIGFFSRGRIQDAATSFAADPTRDLRAWATSARRMAARAALLVCDDLLAAIEALGEDLGPDNTASDLARFWVSDPAFRFRRAVASRI
ncbi:MAG: tetratricopeptide repeat protein [Myxococcota bacterium]|nr:tetratricopeptide repeat protein [Myxococcota bacterium]